MLHELAPKDIDAAESAVVFAAQTRRYHRRRTRKESEQRAQDIERALDRIREAMRPLRREIGRFTYGAQTAQADRNRDRIRQLSAALQAERRKLWKMRNTRRASV